jgi:hypothetical protein
MRIAFAGTHQGMTAEQMKRVRFLLSDNDPDELHHGDCVGADAEAHRIIKDLDPEGKLCQVIIHPLVPADLRAFCEGGLVLDSDASYAERSQAMVDSVDLLITAPAERIHGDCRHGTCATARYAREHGDPYINVYPNGKIHKEFVYKLKGLRS